MSRPTLAVLAGGAGSRMGRPKGELRVAGVPVLARLLNAVAWPGPTLLVTAPGRERPPGSERFDAEAIDAFADQGPLRGVYTALTAAGGPVVVTTVDMPGVGRDVLDWLADTLGAGVALMTRTADGRIEPFPAAFAPAALATIERHLRDGRRSVHGLAGEPGVAVPDAPAAWPAATWTNLNTPADWASFVAGVTGS